MEIYDILNSLVAEGQLDLKEAINMDVAKIHKNPIYFNDGKRKFYFTDTNDGKRKEGKTKENLLKTLEKYYKANGDDNYTFSHIFDEALKKKSITANPNTILRNRQEYSHFIDDKMGKTSVKKIDAEMFCEYVQNRLEIEPMNKAKLNKLKGVFNIVFDYAIDHDIIVKDPRRTTDIKSLEKRTVPTERRPEMKAFQNNEINRLKLYCWERINKSKYDYNALMILFSTETGMRAAELCSLKWEDVLEDRIRIHSQILSKRTAKKKEYYYAPWTKDEKGISKGGRVFPIIRGMKEILSIAKALQTNLNIESEFVFCNLDGDFTNPEAFERALSKACVKLNLSKTNNHAIRMYFNSYVLIDELHLNEVERARLLGHLVETNLKYYTYTKAEDEFIQSIADAFENSNVIQPVYSQKEEALETISF